MSIRVEGTWKAATARCQSSRSEHAQTPHCNVHGSLALALSLCCTWQLIHFPPPPPPHDRPRRLDLVISLRIHLPFLPPQAQIMPHVESVLVIGKHLSIVFYLDTSL